MKKLISMMMIAAAATLVTSCDDTDDDITGTFRGDKYLGTMTVMAQMGPGAPSEFPQEDVTFYFDEENDMATVSMVEICFTEGMGLPADMPSLNIVLPDIPEVKSVEDLYQAESVVATTPDEQPFPDTTIKSITNVNVRESDMYGGKDSLTVSFDCTVSIDMGSGKREVTFSVAYIGYEI